MTEVQAEQLRQEREAFDLRKRHASSWFLLRLTMGYSGLALLVLVAATCGFVLLNHAAFSASLSMNALVVLGGDLLAVLATTWKLVLSPSTRVVLLPITKLKDG
ncbi:MAG TPA: hypothetical protein VHZ26_04235 [Caulobacteraceae bacterium]|jgi:hypothetical protein|nr:hypothetical protein [Caulobacteraceae bacterium]